MNMRWLNVELIYAASTRTGSDLIAQIKQILNAFERGNYAAQNKGDGNVQESKNAAVPQGKGARR